MKFYIHHNYRSMLVAAAVAVGVPIAARAQSLPNGFQIPRTSCDLFGMSGEFIDPFSHKPQRWIFLGNLFTSDPVGGITPQDPVGVAEPGENSIKIEQFLSSEPQVSLGGQPYPPDSMESKMAVAIAQGLVVQCAKGHAQQ